MKTTLIYNANILNEGRQFMGSVLIMDNVIDQIIEGYLSVIPPADTTIDAQGKMLIPGVIDDQVHFRDQGLSYKADIATESAAAVAGGVTSVMDMPNNQPQTTTWDLYEERLALAASKTHANYGLYFGATNDNGDELKKIDPKRVAGVKVFMGSSTGNMLVDNTDTLARIFAESPILVATHCEDEATVQHNLTKFKALYGSHLNPTHHPLIRSASACLLSSQKAVDLARQYGTRLHVLHLTSAIETHLFEKSHSNKKITAEVCAHHLWFDDRSYKTLGNKLKWNPAVKSRCDKHELLTALLDGRIDVIATDHAPHTIEEKGKPYLDAPSGGPLVQHSLVLMLEMARQGKLSFETVIDRMCHAPARLFNVEKRGYIRTGYFADLALVDLNSPWTVSKDNLLYKCQWSPLEGQLFNAKVTHTWVNGALVYQNGVIDPHPKGQLLTFER